MNWVGSDEPVKLFCTHRYKCGGFGSDRLKRTLREDQGRSSFLSSVDISDKYNIFFSANCFPDLTLCEFLSCFIISMSCARFGGGRIHIFSVSRDQLRAAKAWFTWYMWFVANEALEYGEIRGALRAHELKDAFMEKAVNRCHDKVDNSEVSDKRARTSLIII